MGAICRSRWRLVGADPVRNIVLAYLDSHHLSGLAITGDGDVLRTGDLSDLELSLAGGR